MQISWKRRRTYRETNMVLTRQVRSMHPSHPRASRHGRATSSCAYNPSRTTVIPASFGIRHIHFNALGSGPGKQLPTKSLQQAGRCTTPSECMVQRSQGLPVSGRAAQGPALGRSTPRLSRCPAGHPGPPRPSPPPQAIPRRAPPPARRSARGRTTMRSARPSGSATRSPRRTRASIRRRWRTCCASPLRRPRLARRMGGGGGGSGPKARVRLGWDCVGLAVLSGAGLVRRRGWMRDAPRGGWTRDIRMAGLP